MRHGYLLPGLRPPTGSGCNPAFALVALVAMAVLCFVAGRRGGRAQRHRLAAAGGVVVPAGAHGAHGWEPHPAPATAVAGSPTAFCAPWKEPSSDAGPMRGEIEQSMAESEHDEPSPSLPRNASTSAFPRSKLLPMPPMRRLPQQAVCGSPFAGRPPTVSSLPAPAEPQSFIAASVSAPSSACSSRRFITIGRLEPPGLPPRSRHYLHGHGGASIT